MLVIHRLLASDLHIYGLLFVQIYETFLETSTKNSVSLISALVELKIFSAISMEFQTWPKTGFDWVGCPKPNYWPAPDLQSADKFHYNQDKWWSCLRFWIGSKEYRNSHKCYGSGADSISESRLPPFYSLFNEPKHLHNCEAISYKAVRASYFLPLNNQTSPHR